MSVVTRTLPQGTHLRRALLSTCHPTAEFAGDILVPALAGLTTVITAAIMVFSDEQPIEYGPTAKGTSR